MQISYHLIDFINLWLSTEKNEYMSKNLSSFCEYAKLVFNLVDRPKSCNWNKMHQHKIEYHYSAVHQMELNQIILPNTKFSNKDAYELEIRNNAE